MKTTVEIEQKQPFQTLDELIEGKTNLKKQQQPVLSDQTVKEVVNTAGPAPLDQLLQVLLAILVLKLLVFNNIY